MYVVEHPLRDLVLREDPLKVLYLGISPDGLPLEVVVVFRQVGVSCLVMYFFRV